MDCRLADINLYPVKALGPIRPRQAQVTGLGLAGDRRWLLTGEDGRFLSQRTAPALALVMVTAAPEGWLIEAPRRPPLHLPTAASGPRHRVTVWSDTLSAVAGPAEADAWFTAYLGRPCRLSYMDAACVRPVETPPEPGAEATTGHRVSFADGYPCLLISTASLDLLNGHLEAPVTMDRFRPNLVVTGCAPHAEDTWTRFRIGGAVFRAVKPCARCQVTTIDPGTAVPSPRQEPLRTLARYRTRPGGVMFGMNLVVEEEGTVFIGDPVVALPGS